MTNSPRIRNIAAELLDQARARLKAEADAVAMITDPDGLLKLADTVRQQTDARINDFSGRVLPGLNDPRWHDVSRRRNAPRVEEETARDIKKALQTKYPDPAEAEAASDRLRTLLETRQTVQKQFKP